MKCRSINIKPSSFSANSTKEKGNAIKIKVYIKDHMIGAGKICLTSTLNSLPIGRRTLVPRAAYVGVTCITGSIYEVSSLCSIPASSGVQYPSNDVEAGWWV